MITIFQVRVSCISVVSVVSDEIIFNVLMKTSVLTDETISYIVSGIKLFSLASDEITFHLVLNMGLVSVVSYETILSVISKISVVNN